MTLNAGNARDEYTASASQTVFNYTFKIYDSTDLDVYVTPAGQECSDSDLTTSYTVSGVGVEAGGTITLTTPSTAGDLVTIVSSIPTDRTTDYQNNGDFRPDTVNDDFDRVVSLTKQIEDVANRTPQFLPCQQGTSALTLPPPVASNFWRMKSDLSGLENVTINETGIQKGVSLTSYATLRAEDSSTYTDGQVITLTNDGIAGDFVVKTGTVTDNGSTAGTRIVFTDDSNRYAERLVTDARYSLAWTGATGVGGTTYEDSELNGILSYVAAEGGGTVVVPEPTDHYATDSTITVPENVDLEFAGRNMRGELRNYIKPSSNVDVGIDFNNISGVASENVGVDVDNMSAEIITGGTSSATATVYFYDQPNGVLLVGDVKNGPFVAETVTGTSGWTATVTSVDTDLNQLSVSGTTGTVRLSPCGIQVKAVHWGMFENASAINLKTGSIGIKLWVDASDTQGSFWNTFQNCGSQGTSVKTEGVAWAIFGQVSGSKRLTTHEFHNCGGLNAGVNWDIDNCGSGMLWLNPNAEGADSNNMEFDGMSSGVYPTLIGGEVNGAEGWGITGTSIVHAINMTDGANDKGGGTGQTDDNVIHQRGNRLLNSSGRSGVESYWRAAYFQHREITASYLAAESIPVANGQIRVSGNGGAVTLTSNPCIDTPVGDQAQTLVLVGGSNSNTLTIPSGSASFGTRLGADRLLTQNDILVLNYSPSFGDWMEVAYFRNQVQTYTPTNVVTDRSFDADTVAIAELADVVGTIIADLQAKGIFD